MMQSSQNEGLGDFWDSCSYYHPCFIHVILQLFRGIRILGWWGLFGYIHDRREESTLAALSGLPVMLWAQTAQADNFDPGKLKREKGVVEL